MDEVRQENRRREFLWRVSMTFVIAAIFVGAILLLWKAHQVLLLLFAGVLVAIFLRTCACAVSRWIHLNRRWSLLIVVLGILGVLGSIGWFVAPSIADEVEQLKEQLPQAFNHAMDWVRAQPWGKALIEKSAEAPPPTAQAGNAVAKVSQFFSNTVEVFASVVIIIFLGIYLAASPMSYVGLILRAAPRHRRFAVKRALVRTNRTLRSWLLGQLVCMVAIGLCIAIGLHFLHVPLAGALGFVAGLFEFIPTVGPILSAVPALLLSFVESPTKALYVLILFIVVQFIENHTLVPLVQSKAIDLPPVVLILALLLFSTLFGFLGLFLATPLAAVLAVLLDEICRQYRKDEQ